MVRWVADYLLALFSTEPRRIRVIEGTLQGKRTITNLFWAQNYGILSYLGADRHLSRQGYDQWLMVQAQTGNLILNEQTAQLTERGLEAQAAWQAKHYQPKFGQWTWIANWQRLADRFLLAVQLVSEFAYHNRRYSPLDLPWHEKQAVRNWFLHHDRQIVSQVQTELKTVLTQLAAVDERLSNLFAYRLIGHEVIGWSATEACRQLGVQASDLFWMERDAWLFFAHYLTQTSGVLTDLAWPLLATTPLSSSSQQTLTAFLGGHSIEEISHARRLKVGTIREHILQAVILLPGQLPLAQLLPPKVEAELRQRYQGPVVRWQFTPHSTDPGQEFFYFRLFQVKVMQNG